MKMKLLVCLFCVVLLAFCTGMFFLQKSYTMGFIYTLLYFIFIITVGCDVCVHITCFSEFYFHVKSERFGIFG